DGRVVQPRLRQGADRGAGRAARLTPAYFPDCYFEGLGSGVAWPARCLTSIVMVPANEALPPNAPGTSLNSMVMSILPLAEPLSICPWAKSSHDVSLTSADPPKTILAPLGT